MNQWIQRIARFRGDLLMQAMEWHLPRRRWNPGLFLAFCATLTGVVVGAEPSAPRVAVLGDSITYQGGWVVRVESALRSTPAFEEAEIVNFGLPSETVSGLSEDGHAGGAFPRPCLHERLGRLIERFRPTHVLACYGMNDGIYLPSDPVRQRAFEGGIERLKRSLEKTAAEVVFITPPLHDADKASVASGRYDLVLDEQAAWLSGRRADGWKVIDIRGPLREGVASAKARDAAFVYAGDGVHPGEVGQRMIGDIVVDGLRGLWDLGGGAGVAREPALAVLAERQQLLKHAWLAEVGHQRPGIPRGVPVGEASVRAAELLTRYRAACAARVSEWHGFKRHEWVVDGRDAVLVCPDRPAAGRPWIWRTEFFGHEPQADLALLARGFHVVWIDVQNLYGGPLAMEVMDRFHEHLCRRWRLSEKVVLEGFSRGGLFAFNWAARHPGRVAGLYVDAPVCDFKSWPGGKGVGPGSVDDWRRLLGVYGLSEEQALAYPGNPVDNLAPLAKAGIPILAVIGEADEVVPVAENTDLVEQRYRAIGGTIKVIRKPGCKHHPHSLPDPAPIVEFVIGAAIGGE